MTNQHYKVIVIFADHSCLCRGDRVLLCLVFFGLYVSRISGRLLKGAGFERASKQLDLWGEN